MKNRRMEVDEGSMMDLAKLMPYSIEQWLHGIRRYQFATAFLKDADTVLDIGCSGGYGTAIMSKVAKYVQGVDRNETYIKFALKHYPSCHYLVSDILKYDFQFAYDVVTMFECLDHLKKDDGLDILTKAAKSCRSMMFLSLPQDQKFETNPHHLAEWTDVELKNELEKYFSRVMLFGQSWATGSIYYPYEERRSITVFVGIKN